MLRKSGISLEALDRSTRPQDDLFRFVNGTWLDTTEIPDDRARFGTFDILREESTARVRDLIEEAARAEEGAPGTPKRQVGDLYASFTDTDRIEELGLAPLQAVMSEVAAVDSVESLGRALGRLARDGVVGVLQHFVSPDERSPEDYVVYLEQGGLGLPDESYYREEKYAEIRTAYVAHIGRLLGLAGIPDAEAKATRVMALETRLAASHWDRVAQPRRRSRPTTPHTLDEVMVLAPQFPWHAWLVRARRAGGSFDEVVVRQPSFVTGLGAALESVDVADWRSWLTWHVLSEFASLLPQSFVDENFDFYGRTLSGQPEQRTAGSAASSVVEACVGEAVGQALRRAALPAGGQGADGRARRQPRRGLPPVDIDLARLDERRDAGSRRSAKLDTFTPEDRLPGQVARLLGARGRPGRPASATSGARAAFEYRPRARARSASRSTATSGA